MRTAPRLAGAAKAVARPALWFCAGNLLAAVLAGQCSNPTPVPNQTISSGTANYSDPNALAASNVVINGSASVTFFAANCIDLQPGFQATAGTAGTTFHAWVGTAPSLISVAPSSGIGLSQQFTWTVFSPSGYGNLAHVYALFNTSVSGANACYIYYSRGANSLFLANDAGSSWSGFSLGTPNSVSNSQCTIYGNGSSVSGSGNQLAVTVNVAFQPAFAGAKNNYLIAYDNGGLYTGWQPMGTWTVAAPDFALTTALNTYGMVTGTASPAYSLTVTPLNGFGGAVSFSTLPFYGCSNVSFSPLSVSGPPWTTTLTMSCTEQYPNTYVTTVQASGGGLTRQLDLYLNVTTAPQYSLAAAVSPYGAGTMTLNPPGGWYNSGTVVQVSAAPAAGYTFAGFTGNLTGNVLPQTLVMNGNKSVTANFTATPPGQYSLTTSVSTSGAGTITPGSGSYGSGAPVTITATPASGYQFSGFTGVDSSNGATGYVTMNANRSVTANFAPSDAQSFSFPYTDANGTTRTWTITTEALAHVFTWDSSHWTYAPSVVLPSPQTNGKYVLVFSSGTTFGQQGIYVATSDSPTGPFVPSPPTKVLDIGGGLCDIADAVPYWDDARLIWHVYVQGLKWVAGVCPTGTGPGGNGIPTNNAIYEATGPSLTSLSWVLDPNNPGQAREVIRPYGAGDGGIGERIQWFNSTNYLGATSVPFVVTFNDWTYLGQDCKLLLDDGTWFNPTASYDCKEYCPACPWNTNPNDLQHVGTNGTPVFAYAGPDGTSPLYFWYYRQSASGFPEDPQYYPDVILGSSLDAATAGNPGFGFESRACGQGPPDFPDQPCPSYGVGFFPDPVPYSNPNYLPYNGGFYFPGALSGTSATIMFRPRVARNVYGYIDPAPGSSPRTWQTYLYYTDCNWVPQAKGCGFGVSRLTITQQ